MRLHITKIYFVDINKAMLINCVILPVFCMFLVINALEKHINYILLSLRWIGKRSQKLLISFQKAVKKYRK
jgi:hypothetical protein